MNAHISHHRDDDEVRVRRATINDADEIARLLTHLGHPTTADSVRAHWELWTEEGNAAFVVGPESGSLLGVGTVHRTRVLHRIKPVGRITSLVVEEAARGRGIGRKIVEAAELELKGAGCGLLEITSNATRTRAHAFYESLGYEKTSVRLFKDLDAH